MPPVHFPPGYRWNRSQEICYYAYVIVMGGGAAYLWLSFLFAKLFSSGPTGAYLLP